MIWYLYWNQDKNTEKKDLFWIINKELDNH